MGYTSAVRKCIHIEIRRRFNLIHEKKWSGEAVSIICKRYGVSRKTYYKWNTRYKQKGIEGLSDISRRPHNIKYKKVTSEIQETVLDLRLTKRFGCYTVSQYMILHKHARNCRVYLFAWETRKCFQLTQLRMMLPSLD